MSNYNRSPKKSKIVPLFITFAILFIVVFALGVIIGKGLGTDTPEKTYDVETSGIEYGAPQMDEEAEDAKSEVIVLEDEVDLEEDTDTEKTKESASPSESATASESAEPEISQSETKEVAEEEQVVEVVVEKTAPPVTQSPKQSAAMPKIDPNGRYTVQIGAFQNQVEANKLVSSLKSSGYPAFVKQVETPDKKTWYRVRVGTFSTRAEAVSYGDKLKQSETKVKSVFVTTNN